MESKELVGSKIDDPRQRLLNRVAACMLKEPNFYQTADTKVADLINDLSSVLLVDPEFISQLAYYSRNTLNLRCVSNFLLAYAACHEPSREFVSQFFTASVRLPTDLAEVIEFSQVLIGHIPSVVKRLVRIKFKEFNTYQMGKYCSEGRRKRTLAKNKKKQEEKKMEVEPEDCTGKSRKPGKLSMKQIVRMCHVKEPAETVMAILGKRYPANEEEFKASSLAASGEFNPETASKRMKVPTPVTWETELSAKGNNSASWEGLINKKKLPYMAMLRNLRNLVVTGVSDETHETVQNRVSDPTAVTNGRQFPFRYLSAYDTMKDIGRNQLEELQRLHDDPSYIPPEPAKKKPRRGQAPKGNKPRKIIRPVNRPTQELLDRYKDALETAIKIATAENVRPISGHTVIFCDVSGSMRTPVSGAGSLGSFNDCMQIGLLLGLMLRFVCENADFQIFSSPKPPRTNECYRPIELEGDSILDNLDEALEEVCKLGGGTDFPFDYLEKIINEKTHVDTFVILSDMMISPGRTEMNGMQSGAQWTVASILSEYRNTVNPNLLFVTIDLVGHGRNILGAELEDDFRNVLITGYSDSILRLVSELQTSQIETVKESAYEMLEKTKKPE